MNLSRSNNQYEYEMIMNIT